MNGTVGSATAYVGRFAPSPSGKLHFGSLVAALGSWLQARNQGGKWLVRVEDIDPPREVAGAAQDILHTLEQFGLHWDGPVLYQSQRSEAYDQALEQLLATQKAFACACSRADLPTTGVYPGTCRNGIAAGAEPRTIRLRTLNQEICFDDACMGHQRQNVATQVGDFVIKRADGMASYQLAVVLDDAFQGITEVVRGADLLDSTARQIFLQRALGLTSPQYCHLPLIIDHQGRKLSKRLSSDPLCAESVSQTLVAALAALGHPPPQEMQGAPCSSLLQWGQQHWNLARVPTESIQLPAGS